MNRKEIKEKAKEFAFNNKWDIWKPYLIIYGITLGLGFILGLLKINSESLLGASLSFAIQIGLMPLSIGYISYLMKLIKNKKVNLKEEFLSKYNLFAVIFLTTIVVTIFTTFWTLLFIIPGIIYSFKVIMVNYILADNVNSETKIMDVINTSKKMMNGYKWDYFVFSLSFIGWLLLVPLTLGIAIIWVFPYIETANIIYYEELKKLKKIK